MKFTSSILLTGRKQQGFTLLEMMITITILATLTILTSQSIQQAMTQKVKVQTNIDDYSSIRDAVRIIKRDVNLAYHYRDLEMELEEAIKKKKKGPAAPGGDMGRGGRPVQTPEEQQRMQNRQDPTTHFVGTGESINFVTSNHTRVLASQLAADFAEVGYSLRTCTSRGSDVKSNCLWRRTSSAVDDDVTQGGTEIVLLENVDQFQLRYFGEGKQDWVSDWRSTEGGDAVTKDHFPDAVELTLVVKPGEGEKTRTIPVQAVIPLHFPNNKEKEDQEQAQ